MNYELGIMNAFEPGEISITRGSKNYVLSTIESQL